MSDENELAENKEEHQDFTHEQWTSVDVTRARAQEMFDQEMANYAPPTQKWTDISDDLREHYLQKVREM